MKNLIKAIGAVGLALTVFPSVAVFAGALDLQTNKNLMVVGMVLWFASALTVNRVGGKKDSPA